MNLLFVIGTSLSQVAPPEEREGITVLVPQARTAPKYCLYLLDSRWAVLSENAMNGRSIYGELVTVTDKKMAEIVDTEPDSIRLELIELVDGSRVLGAVGDQDWLDKHALNITAFGGYVEYRKQALN